MVRPREPRQRQAAPRDAVLKPRSIPLYELEQVVLSAELMEAVRPCTLEGHAQVEAGRHLGVSRGTVQRHVKEARWRVLEAIVDVKALVLESPAIGHASRTGQKKEIVMRYCFPIARDQGLDSKVFGHFGSAPRFLIVDADTGDTELVEGPEHGAHQGGCRPVERLAGHAFDALIVGGIGAGAIAKFHRIGKRVFLAQAITIQENLKLLASAALPECDPAGACSDPGHAHGGGGCAHGPH